ncbi:hypothetical protein [Xanthomonas sp. D-109]|uniref:hypothetical protein n=1 Tax=Xanthomonas sp. D-109 TaxID=2821274 RepID=UPI001ADB317D|nr:hypothetical protein [Xanthomonas sp. D-109]MBO9880696.1 hypothetical protein [Xanthomonas sp. D-109]
MSWDVSIQRFNCVYTSVDQIPNDEQCLPLGSQAEIRAAISQVFIGTDWSDPTWGHYQCVAGSIEFNMGKTDPNDGFALHVRASSEIVEPIIALCRAHGWQALDFSDGRFLEQSSDPSANLRAWASYRDQIPGKA